MKRVVTDQDELFGPWLAKQLGTTWFPGRGSVIGLWEDGVGPVAGCLYESCNGASIVGHLAGLGRKWMNREYLWFCFHYPFVQLGVHKIIGLVEAGNLEARKLDEHMGFTLEATLKGCAPSGDLLIYTMTRDQCRWLPLGDKYRGETRRT